MADPIKTFVLNDSATPALQRMLSSVQPKRGLLSILGRRLQNDLRSHFLTKEDQPNKSGWPKGHFWSQIRQSTQLESVTEDAAIVTIADPRFSMRYFGGTIRPKEKENLAVPLVPQAAGKYPSANLIPGVFLTFRKVNGVLKKFLVAGEPDNLSFLWVLKKSVTHPKDPTALPPDEKLMNGLQEEAAKYVLRDL